MKTRLYDHQKKLLRFHLSNAKSLDLSDMGVGKSLVALYVGAFLYNHGLIDRIIIICPKTVIATWADPETGEIQKHSNFTYVALDDDLESKLHILQQRKHQVYVISYDSLQGRRGKTKGSGTKGKMIRKLLPLVKRALIVPDEATHVKSATAGRTRAVTTLCDRAPFTLGLTGTPVTNDLTNTITLYRSIDGGKTFGRNFFQARNHFFRNVGLYYPKWELKPEMAAPFHQYMYKYAIRMKKEECLDLPEKIFTNRLLGLTPDQLKYYVPVANGLLKDISTEEGRFKVSNSLTKIAKLSQITGGFIYTDKDPILLGTQKLAALDDIVEELPKDTQVIVFARWRKELDMIWNMMQEKDMNPMMLHGGVTGKDRMQVLRTFGEKRSLALVSQITAGAFGLNLAVCHNIVYYSIGFPLIEWLQSQDRIHRNGQKFTCVYSVLMCKNTIDEFIHQTVSNGEDVARGLTDPKTVYRLKENLELLVGGDNESETKE